MSATIYDIAKKAGVSACCVSYVLRNHPRAGRIRPEVRELIKAAAAELNYHSNLSAVTISNGFNKSTIAMIVSNTDVDAFPYHNSQYFHDIHFFNSHGYGVRIYCGEDMEKVFQEILSNQIRYVFVSHLDSAKYMLCAEICRNNGLKAVFRGISPDLFPDYPAFDTDYRGTAAALVEFLAGLGHTRIAAAFGSFRARANQERYNGWLDALEKCGLTDCSDMFIHGRGFSDTAFLGLLREYRPTAVFASDLSFADRILNFCSIYRIPVPQAFSIVSSDYSKKKNFYLPLSVTGTESSTVRENIESAALAYFEGKLADSVFFTGTIVPGESSAPPSGDLSWLERLPETLEQDRKWFPDNTLFEAEETAEDEPTPESIRRPNRNETFVPIQKQ